MQLTTLICTAASGRCSELLLRPAHLSIKHCCSSRNFRGLLILSGRLRVSSSIHPHRSSTATVAPHEGVASDRAEHLDEGQGPHGDLTGALHLEARLLVKGNQELFTHEDSSADAGQTAEVLQIAPHQDGAFALLTEGPVDGQNVDVNRGPVRFMEGEGVLEDKEISDLSRDPVVSPEGQSSHHAQPLSVPQ